MFTEFRKSSALFWIPVLAGIAALLNGSVFWARRVGLLEPDRYWSPYLALIHSDAAQSRSLEVHHQIMRFAASLHQVDGLLWLTKLAKDGVWVAVLAVLAVSIRKVRLPIAMAAGYIAFAGLALNATASALARGAWLDIVAGGRANLAWVLAALGGSLATRELCRFVARICLVVLVLQAPLITAELVNGLTMYSTTHFGTGYARAVGSFSMPISLGTFAVVTWALALQWGELSRRVLMVVTLLVVLVLWANASATAWVALIITAASILYFRVRLRWRISLLAAALPLLIAGWIALPHITGRGDIHHSLWGRIQPVHEYAAQNLSKSELLFGLGLGVSTNTRNQLAPEDPRPARMKPVGDSMPAVLFWQFGLLGLVLAYGLMGLALKADPGSRLIGICLVISSLTLNLTEQFPLSLLLGLWLARAARVSVDHDRSG